VEELLDREPFGWDARRLAHFQRSFRGRPLVRPRPDELEQTPGWDESEVAIERSLDHSGTRFERERRSEGVRGWAQRSSAPRWLAVNAAEPGDPTPPMTTTGISGSSRDYSSTSDDKRFVLR
jgi:hypothetical protein